uniref:(northern house mosquito) hypothetical protein n=1 Tax=Culex pipiens TaxID=7175 RepID=A0A8D8IMF7_CULPI
MVSCSEEKIIWAQTFLRLHLKLSPSIPSPWPKEPKESKAEQTISSSPSPSLAYIFGKFPSCFCCRCVGRVRNCEIFASTLANPLCLCPPGSRWWPQSLVIRFAVLEVALADVEFWAERSEKIRDSVRLFVIFSLWRV